MFNYTIEHVKDIYSPFSLETLLHLYIFHLLFRQWLETRVILFR
jgi:hypothetical protein